MRQKNKYFIPIFLALYLVFFPGLCGTQAQKKDTVYVLFEESDIAIKGSFGRIIDFDSLADYPYDKGRSYEFRIGKRPISFVYLNKSPDWMDREFEVMEKELSTLSKEELKGVDWFRDSDYWDIVSTFSGKDKVIYLAEKDRIKNGKAIFIRVYFNYQEEE